MDVYCKNRRIHKKYINKGYKDFVFYTYGHSSSRTKKYYYQALFKCSTTALKSHTVYTLKNTQKSKWLVPENWYNLFPFHDKLFWESCIKPISSKKF